MISGTVTLYGYEHEVIEVRKYFTYDGRKNIIKSWEEKYKEFQYYIQIKPHTRILITDYDKRTRSINDERG